MKKFLVSWTVECEIEVDDEVIDRVDDDWRKHLYDLKTPLEIAEHLACNLVMNNARLSQLDGWADMKDSQARLIYDDIILTDSQIL